MTNSEDVTAAIQSRLNAATPGPWKAWNVAGSDIHSHTVMCKLPNGPGVGTIFEFDRVVGVDVDGEFIAHAPEDIAFLLAENARLSACVSALEAAVGNAVEIWQRTDARVQRRTEAGPSFYDESPSRPLIDAAYNMFVALTESEGKTE